MHGYGADRCGSGAVRAQQGPDPGRDLSCIRSFIEGAQDAEPELRLAGLEGGPSKSVPDIAAPDVL